MEEIEVSRYSYSLPGRPNLEILLPALLADEVDDVEQIFQLVLGVQRRRHITIPTAAEVYGILGGEVMPKTRQQIIDDGRRIITEIRQIFADAEHWNRVHPEEEPIEPDPHGTLAELLRRLTGEEPKPTSKDG
jgi:hypothetical protein